MKQLSGKSIIGWFVGILFLKFLLFDLIWAFDTTFSGFQFPLGYLSKLALCCILALPFLWLRSRWYVFTVCIIVDILLIANLMYFRSYYTVIPLSSYMLAGNLADFQESVWESLRLADVVFPLTTLFLAVVYRNVDLKSGLERDWCRVALYTGGAALACVAVIGVHSLCKGGYKDAYEDLMYDYSTCGAAVYTIPGTWLYSVVADRHELTPEVRREIESWLDDRPVQDGSTPVVVEPRDNCIIILAESFESWLLETTFEGIELTPNLNRYLREENVLYAPNMLSQVKGARSIDAQLILHTGLLPVAYGAFSYRFPHHEYPSLDKAFKERHPGGVTASFTVDKKIVWNAVIAAQDFGIDRLLDKPFFNLDVATGPRKRLGDHSFLRQSADKLEGEDIFKTGGHTLVQCVTYSGHTPFIIPDSLKKIHIPERYPERLRNYMEVANYTDRAIGEFIDRLRRNPKFASTMIVITGDHEGIGIDRQKLREDPAVAKVLSPGQFTPLIVLNSPVSMRYDKVLGQMDMYPTLLQLLGLDRYHWRGMGQSILDPSKKGVAVSPLMEVVGEDSLSQDELRHYRDAYKVSDLMISCDYFKQE